jgi:hypothetical protein
MSSKSFQNADKLNGIVSVLQFGAVGDGVTDDTAAIQAAFLFASENNKSISVPSGTYMVSGLSYTPANAAPLVLIGDGKDKTIIKKISAGSSIPVLKVNADGSGLNFQNFIISNITFDGNGVSNASVGLELNDVSRGEVSNVNCKNSNVGIGIKSSYFVSVYDSYFESNTIGVNINKLINPSFPSSPTSNAIAFLGCVIQLNSICAVTMDHCVHIQFKHCGFEVNGTTIGAATHGAIFVGNNIGSGHVGTVMDGCLLDGCWFEQNKGVVAAAEFGSGYNVAEKCVLWTNSTDATYDFNVVGGGYFLNRISIASAKTANVNEGAGVIYGNKIALVPTGNFNINPDKTGIDYGISLQSTFFRAKAQSTGLPSFSLINAITNWAWQIQPNNNCGFYQGATNVISLNGSDKSIELWNGAKILSGAGSPEGVVTAFVGSIYTNNNGGASTTLWIKTSGNGNTGWTAK